MTIKEIVKDYLEKNGYDGLSSEGACSCGLSDLMPCGRANRLCEAGYLVKIEACKTCNRCNFCISPDPNLETCYLIW